ncbi:MAG: T9SS type A sorting domain-containing protein [Sphingobacteriaceae bacterium]|nr:T9SS type A sorting domain-containing protein [Sphingobacteriaceae bacterium]
MKSLLGKYIVPFFVVSLSISTSKAQNIYSIAGSSVYGYSGDGGQAILAEISHPTGVAADIFGNTYISDQFNHCIRKINSSGIITTIAGTGTAGYSGDGGLSTLAQIYNPFGVAADIAGNVYIADNVNHRIRKINTSGIITTIAGNGSPGFSGDGGQATSAQLSYPKGVTVDSQGNVYFHDGGNNVIRKISSSGTINTIAGTGISGFSGDGKPATMAQVFNPDGIAVDKIGNIFIADASNNRIRKINTSGVINTIAGTGAIGYSGDGGTAITAQLYSPSGVSVDTVGNIYISDTYNNRIRKINTSGIINTVGGTGIGGFSGDGGLANAADILDPMSITTNEAGNIYFCDYSNNRIRIVCVNTCTLANINTYFKNNNGLLLFPNPNNGTFSIQIDNIENGVLFIVNSLGQKIHEQKTQRGVNKIATSGIPTGLYHYRLFNNMIHAHSGTVSIE